MTRYVLDGDTHRLGGSALVFGGHPPRLFRLSDQGIERFAQLAGGDDIAGSELASRMIDVAAIHPIARRAPDRLAATTAVVPVRDGERTALEALVTSLRDVARVLVVDDGSTLPVAPLHGAEVLRTDVSAGPAAARNVGWRAVTTELVVFVDSDVHVPDPGWLEALLGHFDDPCLGAVAPRVASRSSGDLLGEYERRHGPLDVGPLPRRVGPGSAVSYVPADALVTGRAALDGVGGFDESLRFGEDVDIVWRLGEVGWTVRYDPSVGVEHEPRATWPACVAQRFWYGSSAGPLAARHPDALPAVRLSSPAAWAIMLAAGGVPLAAGALAGGATVRFAGRLRTAGLSSPSAASTAVRMSWQAHVETARQLGRVLRRTWWPALGIVALWSRRARRLAAVAAAATLADAGAPTDAPLRLADDLAYGAGVWWGVLRTGQLRPLLPSFASQPEAAKAKRYGPKP